MAAQTLNNEAAVMREYLDRSIEVLRLALDSKSFMASMAATTEAIAKALLSGGKLLTCGNGGSASDAQHIAGEFVSRLNYDRPPAAAIALTTDTSVLTAVGNDYGYEHVFERQVLALGQPGDVLLAISTSGKSPNILSAMRAGRRKGMVVVAFTGKSGDLMSPLADIVVHAPSDSTPLIQQIHITAAHIVCGLVEARMFPKPA